MKSIAVFLGSSDNQNPAILEAIEALSSLLAEKKIALIYGASALGLMGKLADSALAHGVNITGVFYNSPSYQEIPHPHLTQLISVDSIAKRMRVMQDLADGIIVFPGGLGTMEELFATWNQARLGLLKKPLGILNIDNFYTPLQDFLIHSMKKEDFIEETWLNIPCIANSVRTLYELMFTP